MIEDPIIRFNAALEGRYRVDRQIGEGGMATVYLAHDERHNRNVALKVLKAELAAVVGAERFLAEIETTAKLTHPHFASFRWLEGIEAQPHRSCWRLSRRTMDYALRLGEECIDTLVCWRRACQGMEAVLDAR